MNQFFQDDQLFVLSARAICRGVPTGVIDLLV